ncbi:MAG: dTMP kinase [Patescibacteria group bacterium]|mgnify:CR=1 FL=1
MAKANNLSGLYIVLDGIVGCGKSEQIRQLKKYLPLDFSDFDFVFTYEPGGTPDTEELREKLKHSKMTPEEEMLLFAKSRAITIPRVIIPVLERDGIIISDRSFTTSLAYQGFGRGLGVNKVWQANKKAINGIFPDILIHLKVGRDVCLNRSAGDKPDKFDKESGVFWKKTDDGFDKMIDFLQGISPNTKIIQIRDPEGKLSVEQTRLAIKSDLYPLIKENIG